MLSSRATKVLLVVLALASVAIAMLAVWARTPDATKITNWPEPLDAERSRALLAHQCRAAADEERLLLVEFSAPWCEHCRAVKQAVKDEHVMAKLAALRPLVLNIGDDDALDALRLELEARAIPAWVVVEPSACDEPPARWPRIGQTYPRGDVDQLLEFLNELPG